MNDLQEEKYNYIDNLLEKRCPVINSNKLNLLPGIHISNYIPYIIINLLIIVASYLILNNYQIFKNNSILIVIIILSSFVITFIILLIYKYGSYKIKHTQYKKYLNLFFDDLPYDLNDSCQLYLKESKSPYLEYSYSMDIYLEDYITRYGLDKNILHRPPFAPKINMADKISNLEIHINTTQGVEIYIIQELPIKKWCNIILSAKDNFVTIYKDYKLLKTIILKANIIKPTNDILFLSDHNQGPNGYLYKLVYWDKFLNNEDIKTIPRPSQENLVNLVKNKKFKKCPQY